MPFEKYGVEENEEQVKSAEQRPHTISGRSHIECPKCKRTLRPQDETGVLLCPACGSAPFEGR